MSDCIFCRIVNGDIPSYKVYEDENFYAFLDINPRNPGHTQVIPKGHYRWVWDVPRIGEYFEVVQKLANAIKRAFNTEYVVSLILGEEVEHAHVWLVPRFEGDGHGGSIDIGNIKEVSGQKMKEAAERIASEL
jgi:histidine triad (HIT) family protein